MASGDKKPEIKKNKNWKIAAVFAAAFCCLLLLAFYLFLPAFSQDRKPSGRLETFYESRTEYLGDSVRVSALADGLPVPEQLTGPSLSLKTDAAPYILQLEYDAPGEALKEIRKDLTFVQQNTILLFSLIGNVDVIRIQVNDKELGDYSRSWAVSVMGGDPWSRTGTLEEMEGFYEEVMSQVTPESALNGDFGQTEVWVVEIDEDNKSLRVEGIGTNNPLGDDCYVDCKDAYLTQMTGGGEWELPFEELLSGDRLLVSHGPVLESYPTQTTAYGLRRLEQDEEPEVGYEASRLSYGKVEVRRDVVWSGDEYEVLQDVIFDYLVQSNLSDGPEIAELPECYLVRQWFGQSENHDYYIYRLDDEPVAQSGMDGWCGVIGEDVFQDLTEIFNKN